MDADFLKKCESLCDKNSDWHGRLLTQQWHVIVTCLHTYSVCRKKSRYELWFELSCNNDISILHTIRFWFLHRHQMSYWSLILPRVLTFRLTWILYNNNISQDILLERRHYDSFLVFTPSSDVIILIFILLLERWHYDSFLVFIPSSDFMLLIFVLPTHTS